MKKKTAVLLINLGTPDKPTIGAVWRYLTQFLNDPRVIDLPALGRFLLVNCIIVPLRVRHTTKLYRQLWEEKGSPLMFHSVALRDKVQEKFAKRDVDIFLSMRYQKPSIPYVLKQIQKGGYKKLIVFPLFPQYASATVGTGGEELMKELKKWWILPELAVAPPYFNHPDFIAAWVDRASKFDLKSYDKILFSYHGLPVRHLNKNHADGKTCAEYKCKEKLTDDNYFCYQAECYETTRLIAQALNIPKEKFQVTFQSKLGKTEWVGPATNKTIENLAKSGTKKVLVFSPAFVADCIETNIEIGVEYKYLFEKNGGKQLDFVESLNGSPKWVEAVNNIVESYL